MSRRDGRNVSPRCRTGFSHPSAEEGDQGRYPDHQDGRRARRPTAHGYDRFKQETFEYIAAFFTNSLDELATRNHAIEGDFRRINANRFIAVVYRNGKSVARCTVFMGGSFFGDGIAYAATETTESNSCNETLRVEADDQMLYLTSMGMAHVGGRVQRESKLSQEGAAELYWSMLIEPLQPKSPSNLKAGFLHWQLVVGSGQERRVLFDMDLRERA